MDRVFDALHYHLPHHEAQRPESALDSTSPGLLLKPRAVNLRAACLRDGPMYDFDFGNEGSNWVSDDMAIIDCT
jgi:hypothetical protein